MRKTAVATVTMIVTSLAAGLAALPAQAASRAVTACSTPWGTGQRHQGPMVQTRVRDVRVGKHACFDRIVIDLGAGAAPGYAVRYVRAFYAQGSGQRVPARGSAKLLVNVEAPAAGSFDSSGRYLAAVAGFAEFRQVTGLGSFEGITSIGIGLRARAPFRVFELRNAQHKYELVVDVAHR